MFYGVVGMSVIAGGLSLLLLVKAAWLEASARSRSAGRDSNSLSTVFPHQQYNSGLLEGL